MKGYRGQTFRLTLGADHKTLDLGGTDKLAAAVFGDEATEGTEAEQRFVRETAVALLRFHLQDAFLPRPGKAVAVGARWRNKTEFSLAPIARVTMDREYTLAGPQVHDGRRVEAVTWRSRPTCTPLADPGGVLPLKITELKTGEKSRDDGTALWDPAARRPARIDTLFEYDIDMTMDVKGKAVRGTGAGRDSFVFRFLPKNPDEK